MIYHLGEEQVYAPSKTSYKFCLFMESVLKVMTCGTLDYLIPDFTEFSEKRDRELKIERERSKLQETVSFDPKGTSNSKTVCSKNI